MSGGISKKEISKELGQNGLMINSKAANKIIDSEPPNSLIISEIIENSNHKSSVDIDFVTNIIQNITENDSVDEVVQEDEVDEVVQEDEVDEVVQESNKSKRQQLDKNQKIDIENAFQTLKQEKTEVKDAADIINRKETLDERYPELCSTMFEREMPEIKPRVGVAENQDITGDITGESRGTGDYEDFQSLFESRFNKLSSIISKRAGGNVFSVSDIRPRQHGGQRLTIIGLVWNKFTSSNDNYFLELEDPNTNDTFRVCFTSEDIKEDYEKVVPDEIVAIRGKLSEDGGIMFGDDEVRQGKPPIMFPSVPRTKSRNGPDKTLKAAFISDVHIGAEEFYADYWNNFVDWVRETPTVEYVFIAGDLVEGIGVYPNQDEELEILDIYDQYAMMGKMLDQLPEDVNIYTCVGNHDTVRLAEPQPTLDEEFTTYFSDNVVFTGNPSTVTVDGISVLMYHGMSIHALSEVIPSLNADEPTEVMKTMLEKRHVAPVYGKNVRLAGEEEDYLVIEDVPDVLHCGHVHKYGEDNYHGIKLLNTATWQGQTTFQKSKGIEPDVGYWSVIDLSTMDVETMKAEDF